MPGDIHRVRLYYSGRVQGVGFRYQTRQVATGYAVCGWVRNLPDGRVEVDVEGPVEELEGFCADLESTLAAYIHDKEVQKQLTLQNHMGFTIRR